MRALGGGGGPQSGSADPGRGGGGAHPHTALEWGVCQSIWGWWRRLGARGRGGVGSALGRTGRGRWPLIGDEVDEHCVTIVDLPGPKAHGAELESRRGSGGGASGSEADGHARAPHAKRTAARAGRGVALDETSGLMVLVPFHALKIGRQRHLGSARVPAIRLATRSG